MYKSNEIYDQTFIKSKLKGLIWDYIKSRMTLFENCKTLYNLKNLSFNKNVRKRKPQKKNNLGSQDL